MQSDKVGGLERRVGGKPRAHVSADDAVEVLHHVTANLFAGTDTEWKIPAPAADKSLDSRGE